MPARRSRRTTSFRPVIVSCENSWMAEDDPPQKDLAGLWPGLPRGPGEGCTGQLIAGCGVATHELGKLGWEFCNRKPSRPRKLTLMLQCEGDQAAQSAFPLLAVTGGAEAEAWTSKGPVVRLRQNLDHNLCRAQHIRVSTMPRFGIEEP